MSDPILGICKAGTKAIAAVSSKFAYFFRDATAVTTAPLVDEVTVDDFNVGDLAYLTGYGFLMTQPQFFGTMNVPMEDVISVKCTCPKNATDAQDPLWTVLVNNDGTLFMVSLQTASGNETAGPFTISQNQWISVNTSIPISVWFYAVPPLTANNAFCFRMTSGWVEQLSLPVSMKPYDGKVYAQSLELSLTEFINGVGNNYFTKYNPPILADSIEIFHEHMFFLGADGISNRLRWSQVYEFFSVVPAAKLEADYYDFVREVEDNGGMVLVGNTLYVHFPFGVYAVDYVGKPYVMQVMKQPYNRGSAAKRGLVTAGMGQFFMGLDNFYFIFMGQLSPIGTSIWPFFMKDVNLDFIKQTWAYVDPTNREIHWVYVSNESTMETFDKSLVFNYETKVWYQTSVEGFGCQESLEVDFGGEAIFQMSQDISAITQPIYELGLGDNSYPNIFGGSDNAILSDVAQEGDTAVINEGPFLETSDLFYDQPTLVKEFDAVTLDANYNSNEIVGVQVQYSARTYLSDSLTWKTIPQLWTNELPERRLSWVRDSGRILRFRFKPVVQAVGYSVVDEFTVSTGGSPITKFDLYGYAVRVRLPIPGMTR